MCQRMQTFVFLFIWLSCQVSAVTFEQFPPQIVKEKTEVHIKCSHGDSSLLIMYWYQLKQDSTSLTLIGFGYQSAPNYEGDFEQQFELTRQSITEGALTIKKANQSHSAVYFCAASTGNYEPAYFGKGTKLTVLETDLKVTPPTNVKILPPSPNECRNQKDKKRKKTLVCVASGFYPDHVKVLWKINEKEAKDGVATDSAAERQVDKFYRITSRLRVPAEDYNTASNTFTCIVSFFDGEKTTFNETSINGIQGKTEGGMTREEYLRLTQSAKLSYTVVIIKSCFYGVFVGVLVWKLQGSARKHH